MLDGSENAGEMWRIIGKVCNGSNVGENPLHTVLEATYNLLLIRGNDYRNTEDYLDSFEQYLDMAEKAGWLFSSEKLRDLAINKYFDRNDFGETY